MQHGISLLAPFPLSYANQHSRTIDVRNLQLCQLADPQPGRKWSHEQRLVSGVGRSSKEAPQLPVVEHLGQLLRLAPPRNPENHIRPSQHALIEKSQARSLPVVRTVSVPPVPDEMHQIVLHFVTGQLVRTTVEMHRQLLDRFEVQASRSIGQPAQIHDIFHLLA